MTNDELRIEIAKILGWKEYPDNYYGDRRSWGKEGMEIEERFPTIDFPDYPQSLDACKELIEWMRGKGFLFTLWSTWAMSVPIWNASFHKTISSRGELTKAEATPELAICRAFLAANQKEAL